MNIKLKYSRVYEKHLNEKAPAIPLKEIEEKMVATDKFWKSSGPTIEKALKDVTGLSFTGEEITCYLNSGKSFFDPLSLKIEVNTDMENNLVHELIHVLLAQNHDKYSAGWEAMLRKFATESFTTRVHIGIHAIHYLVAEKVTPERTDRLANYPVCSDCVKSWDIVRHESPQKIIDLVFK